MYAMHTRSIDMHVASLLRQPTVLLLIALPSNQRHTSTRHRPGAEGDPNNVGHVITTVGGSGTSKQVIRYLTERVVGNGSFGVVFQAKCIETGETVRWAAASCQPAAPTAWQLAAATRPVCHRAVCPVAPTAPPAGSSGCNS